MQTVRSTLTSSMPPYRRGWELSIDDDVAADPGLSWAGRASYGPEGRVTGGPDPSAPAAFSLVTETHLDRKRRLANNRQRKRRGLPPHPPGYHALSRISTPTGATTSVTESDGVTGGKGGVFLHGSDKKKARTAEKTEETTERHPPSSSPPAREQSRVIVTRRVTGQEGVTKPFAPPAPPPFVPSDWGFAEWWTAWEALVERLELGVQRTGSRTKAFDAWKRRRHALDPSHPLTCLSRWGSTQEWSVRGKLCNPERFLEDDKYTPPRKQAWKPSGLLVDLPHEQWCLALLDAETDLRRRGMLDCRPNAQDDPATARLAVLSGAADNRSLLNQRFWHDLLAATPTVKAWELYGRAAP